MLPLTEARERLVSSVNNLPRLWLCLLAAAGISLWPGSPAGAYAMVGAAAMIGAAMQAPLAGLVLVLELTRSGFQLMVPMIAATAIATAVSRYIDGYSIYSARLPADG